jgi:alkylhydroperoxidase family enzyme
MEQDPMTEGARIPPLPESEWTDGVRALFRRMEGLGCVDGVPKLNVPLTLAHHLELAEAFQPFGGHLLLHSSLPKRTYELVTLRTAWLSHSPYEWARHEPAGRRAGLTDAQIDGIKAGPDAAVWTDPLDRALLRAVDQLKRDSDIDDELWAILVEHFDNKQIMDLIMTIGMYAMLAMLLNAARVQMEDGPFFTPA